MNVLIVFAHPEHKSMNGLLKDKAVETLERLGYQVRVSDLYALNFPAYVTKSDFPFYDADVFDLQMAQAEAQQRNQQPIFVQREHEKLVWADTVVFQFPLWWYSVPAVLKSYIDNVFSAGFAYTGNFVLQGKKYMLSFTTGAPGFMWTTAQKGSIDQLLFHLDVGTFQMLRMEKLQPLIGFGTKRMNNLEREQVCNDFETHLQNHL